MINPIKQNSLVEYKPVLPSINNITIDKLEEYLPKDKNSSFFNEESKALQIQSSYNRAMLSPAQQISFGYSSPLKTLFKKGKLPTVVKGFYGDVLTKENVSLEHLLPHSKGGKTRLNNLVLASKKMNNARGNESLVEHFDLTTMMEYLAQFKDVKAEGFNGNRYIKDILETVNRLIKEGK